jgi:asparagine synthase (glutamine-hydrolysing)
MKYFVACFDVGGEGIHLEAVRPYEILPRQRGLGCTWHRATRAAVLVASDEQAANTFVVEEAGALCVGHVRLDNRQDIERLVEVPRGSRSDLHLALLVIHRFGTEGIHTLLGDFGFIVWQPERRSLMAVTDAFAIRRLFYSRHRRSRIDISSRAEGLTLAERYSPQYFAELVAGCVPSPHLSPYDGVLQVPAGSFVALEGDVLATHAYWSLQECKVDASWRTREAEAVATCRHLMAESVRQRMSPGGETWAQLSGGLDSSSIVSLAEWMHSTGDASDELGGTITYVDRQGTDADERVYANEVIAKWGGRNYQIIDPPFWLEAEVPPPITDRPRDALALYPRERRLLDVVRANGGHSLLTGFAGDELFSGTMFFFADRIARGHPWTSLVEMTRRAAIGRGSLWHLAYENVVLPIAPASVRRWMPHSASHVLPWITADAVKRYDLQHRMVGAAVHNGTLGNKYEHAARTSIAAVVLRLDAGYLGDHLDVRYPYLSRPLVEFALSLPPDLCVRPQARKWILREAMRGILPEKVRSRIGKGGLSMLLAWSLGAQKELLEPLTKDSVLASLGIVDPVHLRAALFAAPSRPHRSDYLHTQVQATLISEAWLQLRSGRWPPRSRDQPGRQMQF